ncbi:MAG: hypothetical protein N2V78_09515 [Methanophagales archaeon]|nr:hypothetical protein [Methanophagales archaeon]
MRKDKIYESLREKDKVKAIYVLAKEYKELAVEKCDIEYDNVGVKIVADTLYSMMNFFEKIPSFCFVYSYARDGKVVLRIFAR